MTGAPIRDVLITPIAFADPPLLNVTGVHEPLALRIVVQVVTADGVVGFGECQGGRRALDRLHAVREQVLGVDVFATTVLETAVARALPDAGLRERMTALSPLEVACLDAQGKLTGLPVSELLGGRVRDAVPYCGYLFYKWPGHPAAGEADEWGAALDPDGVVAQARLLVQRYGFGSLKLKGGVFAPDEEIAAVRALRAAFPELPLRIDPNCAWTPATGIRVARELDGVLEYLEDPSPGIGGMSEVAARAPMPLATNMCVTSTEDLPEAVARRAVAVVLADHHYWGGLRHTVALAATCATFGLGLSMHSNSHLGISLAAMTHVAAAIPTLTSACDTHYPWNARDDVVVGGIPIVDGAVAVPTGPGLGVEVDLDAVGRLHEVFVRSGREERRDADYLRRFRPEFDPAVPRW